VTSSQTPPIEDEAANPDRRGAERAPKIETCFYQLTHFSGQQIVEFSDGHGLSLNTSPGGFLLLMSKPPESRQVFEVYTSLSKEERTVKLVEACWTRELTFGVSSYVYLVGVRFLFETACLM